MDTPVEYQHAEYVTLDLLNWHWEHEYSLFLRERPYCLPRTLSGGTP